MSFVSTPAAGTPPLRDTAAHIAAATRELAAGTGPIAIDTERASAYRYNDRAFLIQLRRRGAGTFLIDPGAQPEATRQMAEVLNQTEWILHAAHTDLPCLLALGWRPPALHDTQIAGQILGLQRFGLSAMLEAYFDIEVPKDKGDADWSRRPLSQAMLNYAALDVEWLIELSEHCLADLAATDRRQWYDQECAHVLDSATALSAPEWTGLKGLNSLRHPNQRKAAHHLWDVRNDLARTRDISPESILRSRDLVAVANRAGNDPNGALRQLNQCLQRSRVRLKPRAKKQFSDALRAARQSPDTPGLRGSANRGTPLPHDREQYRAPKITGPFIPDHKTWPEDYPRAAAYEQAIIASAEDTAELLQIRLDTIVTKRNLRTAAWACWLAEEAGQFDEEGATGPEDAIATCEELLGTTWAGLGLRPWQVDLLLNATTPAVVETFAAA